MASVRILIFSIGGVRFGADTGQVAEICDPGHPDLPAEVCRFDDGLSFGHQTVCYRSPKVLRLRGETGDRGILIEQPEDMADLPADQIRPLPPLIRTGISPCVRGVVTVVGKMILLVDLYQLLGQNIKMYEPDFHI